MWQFIYVLVQIFLWVVGGAFFTLLLAIPIIGAVAIFEFIMSFTFNNILVGAHKIPIIGPLFSGIIGSGIGVIICVLGLIVWVNYLFIVLRCIGGPTV